MLKRQQLRLDSIEDSEGRSQCPRFTLPSLLPVKEDLCALLWRGELNYVQPSTPGVWEGTGERMLGFEN
jgi:hypothetical protein